MKPHGRNAAKNIVIIRLSVPKGGNIEIIKFSQCIILYQQLFGLLFYCRRKRRLLVVYCRNELRFSTGSVLDVEADNEEPEVANSLPIIVR